MIYTEYEKRKESTSAAQNNAENGQSRLRGGLAKNSVPTSFRTGSDSGNRNYTVNNSTWPPQDSRLKGSMGRVSSHGVPIAENNYAGPAIYCKKCGRKLPSNNLGCPICDSRYVGNETKTEDGSRKWPISIISVAAALLLVFALVSMASGKDKKADYSAGVQAPKVTAQGNMPAQTARPSTPAPTISIPSPPTPTPKPHPGPDDMRGCDSRITVPNSYSWLNDYETRYVQSTGGVSIYLRYGPSANYDYFDTVKEAESVTVLADEDGFSLVLASNNRIGWCKSSLLVRGEQSIAPVPSFNETYWTCCQGQTLSSTYACLFHANGTYSAYDWGGGSYSEGTYTIEGRRLKLDGVRYLWDGTQFVSTEKHEMRVGSDYYYLTVDPTAYYEEIKAIMNGGASSAKTTTSSAGNTLSDGEHFVQLISEERTGGHDFLTAYLLQIVGVAQSANPIFDNTGKAYTIRISDDCTIFDSSKFDEDGLTKVYYSSFSPIFEEYGAGTLLCLEIENEQAVTIEKFYMA